MTTGFDNLVKHIPIVKGNFINDNQLREAAIGDKAADRLFRNINIVGQNISIFKQEYIITGVIKNSDDIYITFDEGGNISWSKKNIKFIIENQKYLYLYTEMLEGKLRILNLDVLDRVIYKQEAYMYINIMIVVIVIFLFEIMKKQIDKTVRSFKEICTGYKEQSRSIEVSKYLKKRVNDIFWIAKDMFLSVVNLAAIIKCISFLQIPTDMIPNNLFALTSYIDVIKQNAGILLNRLDYGISGITLDNYIINLLGLIVLIGMLFYMNKSRQYKDKEKTEKLNG